MSSIVQFSERLLSERKRLGLTQQQMADHAGVQKRAYNYYESGERFPDAKVLMLLSRVGVDVLYLLTNARTPSANPTIARLDKGLLATCMAGVEEGLEASGRIMDPEKKAELVVMLYDLHLAADSPPQKATILQFIKRAA